MKNLLQTVLAWAGAALLAVVLFGGGFYGLQTFRGESAPFSNVVFLQTFLPRGGTESMWHPITTPAPPIVLLVADTQDLLPDRDRFEDFFVALAATAAESVSTELADISILGEARARDMSVRFRFKHDDQLYAVSGHLAGPDIFNPRQQITFVPRWIEAETLQNVPPPSATVSQILQSLGRALREFAQAAAVDAGLPDHAPA